MEFPIIPASGCEEFPLHKVTDRESIYPWTGDAMLCSQCHRRFSVQLLFIYCHGTTIQVYGLSFLNVITTDVVNRSISKVTRYFSTMLECNKFFPQERRYVPGFPEMEQVPFQFHKNLNALLRSSVIR